MYYPALTDTPEDHTGIGGDVITLSKTHQGLILRNSGVVHFASRMGETPFARPPRFEKFRLVRVDMFRLVGEIER